MKTFIKSPFTCLGAASFPAWVLPALIGLALLSAGRVTAQTFTILHSFAGFPSDGANPKVGLILSGNTLYGTTSGGGSSGYGTVFAVNTDGSGFTNLYSFNLNGSGGIGPRAGLILSGSTLYGTASGGGSSGYGTLFKINTNGTGFTNFYTFTAGSGGINPYGALILAGNTLYGTTYNAYGTVFAVSTNGSNFTNLHSFTATFDATNSDGAHPIAGLILLGNTLYGTTSGGGNYTRGTLFAVNTDSTGFTNLHNFTYDDGANPLAGLIVSGSTLYGMTPIGGFSGQGVVFAISTNGSGFTNLYSFGAAGGGADPEGGLLLSGNTLYGTASAGGSSAYGTVFRLNTDGTGYTNLHNFTFSSSDGSAPYANLILSSNTLYGTTYGGGGSSVGTVFSLSLPLPKLAIVLAGTNAILTWPTNAAVFTLQSTTNLVSPAVWITNSPAPVVVNGQNAVTNPVTGTQNFYRLSQ